MDDFFKKNSSGLLWGLLAAVGGLCSAADRWSAS